jgi:hypothetical protein
LQLIDKAEGEREFGTDYGEGWALGFDYAEHGGEVRSVDRDRAHSLRAILEANLRDACIAWGADDLGDACGFGQRPDDGVLTSASADNQNFH